MLQVKDLLEKKARIAVVGLGYVGLPLAAAFSRKFEVVGFDVSESRVQELISSVDSTGELTTEDLTSSSVEYSSDEACLRKANFLIVTVPTPVDSSKKPDLGPVVRASRSIGRNLAKGSIVVYESTVYPGVTEEVCVPLLEEASGLKCGVDFKVGYSPERINPGDRVHTIDKIIKVVSGQDEETLEIVAKVYEQVVMAGVHRASSIMVAEASKVIENTQRDLNISLMNELSIIFDRLGISTADVLEAAATKWNFLQFSPGLVGGHCIGVDPYYLTYKAETIGYNPQVILAGRRINDSMAKYVAEQTVKKMIHAGKAVYGSHVVVLGITFKENVPDIRNSKVIDLIRELQEYGVRISVLDPKASKDEVMREFGMELGVLEKVEHADAVVLAVPHMEYLDIEPKKIKAMCVKSNGKNVVVDVKGVWDRSEIENEGLIYWAL